MKTELDIITRPEIQKIFDHFRASFDIVIQLFTVDGKLLKAGLNSANSSFCQCVHQLYGEEKCLILDEKKRKECAEKGTILHYQCHAGIEEAIAPIFFNGQLAGFVMIGQFRSTNTISASVECDWRKKFGSDVISTRFQSLPFIAPARVKDIVGLFQVLVDYIMTKEIVALKGDALLNRILSHIKANLHRPIRLAEVAKLVERSESTISHLFKSGLGRSFKDTLMQMKIDQAVVYFKTMPNLSIQEVAEKVGFDDPFHFSRQFRKRVGMPPSEYRKQI